MTHVGDLREAFLTLYGLGAMNGAGGLVLDVAIAQARKPTIAGRVLLTHMVGPAVDTVIAAFRDGPGLATEELIPLLRHPRSGAPSPVPDLDVAIDAVGPPSELLADDDELA